ncbi:hypothetical protein [Arthrobacter sp. ES3-54]|uniref:hypothetical protein n=1 Tax=Arthrobacter sp. ES3-54 TaxID=1502991 RepID=UPI002404959E|nr:hypothetical protein [Arthrobacter sp. ES3-54]MDF9751515.1 hypothetical protein [Arthrobacter sp. ES3-54]
MEFAAILLAGLVVYAAVATIVAVFRDGRGHTPPVRSTRPWMAGNLPSEPYASLRSLR